MFKYKADFAFNKENGVKKFGMKMGRFFSLAIAGLLFFAFLSLGRFLRLFFPGFFNLKG